MNLFGFDIATDTEELDVSHIDAAANVISPDIEEARQLPGDQEKLLWKYSSSSNCTNIPKFAGRMMCGVCMSGHP